MQLSYWSSTPGSHLRLPDWPSKLKTLSMLELVILVMTLYGVVYSSPAGAQCHLGMAATTHGSLQFPLLVSFRAKSGLIPDQVFTS